MKMKLVFALVIALSVGVTAQEEKECPMHAKHMAEQKSEGHYDSVNKRGAAHEGMGFSQSATTHHFYLTGSGGLIQVTANDASDKDSIAQVQQHFQHIAKLFSDGDFSIPHFVHDTSVPGVKVMQQRKQQIKYTPEKLDNGAKLKIETSSPEALAAIHEFLRFQISDHRTGDSGEVERSSN